MIDPGEGYEWKDHPTQQGEGGDDCPAAWFSKFSEDKAAAEVLNCSVPEVEKFPLHWKLTALAFAKVMEKAKPFLQERADAKARARSNERDVMGRVLNRRPAGG